MSYGTLVTRIEADLTQLKANLKTAEALLERFHKKAQAASSLVLGASKSNLEAEKLAKAASQRLLAEEKLQQAKLQTGALVARLAAVERRELDTIRKMYERDADDRIKQRQRDVRSAEKAAERKREIELKSLRDDITNRAKAADDAQRRFDKDTKARIAAANLQGKANEKAAREGLRASGGGVSNQAARQRAEAKAADDAEKAIARANDLLLKNEQFKDRIARKNQERLDKEHAGVIRNADRLKGIIGAPFFVGGRAVQKFGDLLENMSRKHLSKTQQNLNMLVDTAKLIGGVAIVGGIAEFVKQGIELNVEFQKAQRSLAATLLIATDIVDTTSGKTVKGVEALEVAGLKAQEIFKEVRKVAAETTLTSRELFQVVSENVGFSLEAGLGAGKEAIAVMSQIAVLAKNLGLPGGERQLTQEVRALLSGERLQGASVAKLIGFTDVDQIKKLQQEGKFAEEVQKRLNRAILVTKTTANQFEQVISTIRTQLEDFTRVAFGEGFVKLEAVLVRIRDRMTDKEIEAAAKRFGKVITNMADALLKFVEGGGLEKIAKVFEFIASNSGTIIKTFVAMKVAGAVFSAGIFTFTVGRQALESLIAARNALREILAAQKAIKAAQVAGTATDLAGSAIAGGGFATSKLAGIGAGIAKAFLFALTKVAIPVAIGKALGDAVNAFIIDPAKDRIAAEKANLIADANRARLPQKSEDLLNARDRLANVGRLEQQLKAEEKKRGRQFGFDQPLLLDVEGKLKNVSRKSIAEEREAAQNQVQQAEVALSRRQFGPELPFMGPPVPDELLKRDKELIADRKLKADQFRLDSVRQKERERQARIAREKERIETAIQLAQDRKDKVAELKAELEQEKIRINETVKGADNRRKLIVSATKRTNREVRSERESDRIDDLKREVERAERTGDLQQKIRSEFQVRVLEARKLLNEGEIDEKEFAREVRAAQTGAAKEFLKERQEATRAARELGDDFTDAIFDQAKKQKDIQRELREFAESTAKKQKELVRGVADAQKEVNNAIKEQKRLLEDLASSKALRSVQKGVKDLFTQITTQTRLQRVRTGRPEEEGEQGAALGFDRTYTQDFKSIQARLLEKERSRIREENPSLSSEQRESLAQQRVKEFERQVAGALTGEGGIAQVRQMLAERGITLSGDEERKLADLGLKAGAERETIARRGETREVEDEERTAADAAQRISDARDKLGDAQAELAKFPEEVARTATELRENFQVSIREASQAFRDLAQKAVETREKLSGIGMGGSSTAAKVSAIRDRAGVLADQPVPVGRQGVRPVGGSFKDFSNISIQEGPDGEKVVKVGPRTGGALTQGGVNASLQRTGISAGVPNSTILDPRMEALLPAGPLRSALKATGGSGTGTITLNVGNLTLSPESKALGDAFATSLEKDARRMMPAGVK